MAIATVAIPIHPARQTYGAQKTQRGKRRQKPPQPPQPPQMAHREYTTQTAQKWQATVLSALQRVGQALVQAVTDAFAAGAAEPARPANAAQAPTADAAWGELLESGAQSHEEHLEPPKQTTPQDAPPDAPRGGRRNGREPVNAPVNAPERIASYEAFFQRHEHDIFGYLWRLTGDEQLAYDLRQETFLRAWSHYDQLQEYHQPVAWLFRVATNLAINQLRRRKAPVGAAAPLDLVGDPGASDPSGRLVENDLVRQTLMALPPRQRAALVMREIYGLSVEEVARTLGVTPAAVRMTLWRAREQFRTLYTRANGAPRWSPGAMRQRAAAHAEHATSGALGSLAALDTPDDQQTQPVEAYHTARPPIQPNDNDDDPFTDVTDEHDAFQYPGEAFGTDESDGTEGGEA